MPLSSSGKGASVENRSTADMHISSALDPNSVTQLPSSIVHGLPRPGRPKGFLGTSQKDTTECPKMLFIQFRLQYPTEPNNCDIASLQKSTQKKLSKATIETLSIIVYHQPVTRSEIEQIRGVAFGSNTIEILMELDWVRPSGRKNIPGKPIQYSTTENFLNHFNIQKLSDLPTIDELGSAGLIDTSTIDKSIFGTGKFYKEQSISEKQNIYEDIDEAIKKAPEEEK